MSRIRRAAVTGLFAIWLAPLSAGAQGQPAGSAATSATRPATQIQSLENESRTGRRGWDEQDAAREGEDGEEAAAGV